RDLVAAEQLADGVMGRQVLAQLLLVAEEVQALLEAIDIARGEAEPLHTQPFQLAGHDVVLDEGGDPGGLVDRDLHLHLMAGAADQVLVQAHGLGDPAPYLTTAVSMSSWVISIFRSPRSRVVPT